MYELLQREGVQLRLLQVVVAVHYFEYALKVPRAEALVLKRLDDIELLQELGYFALYILEQTLDRLVVDHNVAHFAHQSVALEDGLPHLPDVQLHKRQRHPQIVAVLPLLGVLPKSGLAFKVVAQGVQRREVRLQVVEVDLLHVHLLSALVQSLQSLHQLPGLARIVKYLR